MADTLRQEGWKPTYADPDLWYKDVGDCYEYVSTYVDDLCHISSAPEEFYKMLMEKHNFKLKGVGPLSYHLGGNFYCKPDGTLCWGSQK